MSFPDLLGLYCLSAWTRRRAIPAALRLAPQLFSRLPDPEREHKLLGLLRWLAEAGADVTVLAAQALEDAIKTGSIAVLEDLLQLMASSDPAGMCQHVAACCSVLANCGSMPGANQLVVRLLVRAITVTARVPIHYSTFITAVRVASCAGNSSVLAGLLEAKPPANSITTALHFATKTEHGDVVEQLIAAGGEVREGEQRNALCNAYPQMVRTVVAARQRSGNFGRDAAAEALCSVAVTGSSYYRNQDEELAQRGATIRMLVGEFGADPAACSSCSLATAAAQREPMNRLADLLLLIGADADAALVSLCGSVPREEGPLPAWQRDRHANGVQGLLALGAESEEGALRALDAALERGLQEPARLLLGTGAVPAAACEGLLLRALRAESRGAVAGRSGGAATTGGSAVEQEEAPGPGENGAERRGEAVLAQENGQAGQQPQQRRRRWDWVRELARAGALRQGAVAQVERTLEEACRQGDAEVAREMASLGLAGPDSCEAAFWLAFDGGHEACMRQLRQLGAVSQEVLQEAQRVLAARETLRRLRSPGSQAAG